MSEDARNSIPLWVGGVLVAALLWAIFHFDLLAGVPRWLVEVGQGLLVLNLIIRAGLAWRTSRKRKVVNG